MKAESQFSGKLEEVADAIVCRVRDLDRNYVWNIKVDAFPLKVCSWGMMDVNVIFICQWYTLTSTTLRRGEEHWEHRLGEMTIFL